MRNKKAPQTVSARHDAREHLSIEAYHKLNRASAVSQFVGGDLIHRELSGLHQLSVPHILSYLHEDISYVLEELKAKGAAEATYIEQVTVLFTDFKGFTAMSDFAGQVEDEENRLFVELMQAMRRDGAAILGGGDTAP